MIAAALLATAAAWVPVGVSDSRLRVFFEARSVRDAAGHRFARVRIGSPQRIAGPIVPVYQDEEIDCTARTWRLFGFDARDAEDRVVKRSSRLARPGTMLPGVAGTIGGEVIAAVCASPPVSRGDASRK